MAYLFGVLIGVCVVLLISWYVAKQFFEIAKAKGYKTTSNKESVLNYVTDEVNLEDGQGAVSVTIPHSNLQTVKYVYNQEEKVYENVLFK